jgi:glycosyltransferase involved in cell wall biosynthesis
MNISVIIPVYNKESYLDACFEGILQQDFHSFEVIAVDDGSQDNSGAVCDRWAAKDSRIRVFHTPNGGVTAARRYGLSQSEGDYVMFVDADDALLPHAMQRLYQDMQESGADEVIGSYITQHGIVHDSGYRGFVDVLPLVQQLLATKNNFCVLWGILFKRELLQGCLDTPREIIEREDILMQIKCMMKRPRIFFSFACVYLYNEGLPNNRVVGLDVIRLYDGQLKNAIQPYWAELRTDFVLHQIKTYEALINIRQFHVYRDYYYQLKSELTSAIPLLDRIVFSLPPRIAYYPIHWYKRWNSCK